MNPVNYVRSISTVMASALVLLSMPIGVTAASYSDKSEITSHVKFKLPEGLQITRPLEEIGTNEAGYFITGSSIPDQPLLMNGEVVSTRGQRGSFGVYATIDQDVNVFQFKQGTATQTVSIRKGAPSSAKISTLRNMSPSFNMAINGGDDARISCEAPAGASVVAQLGSQSVTLKQKSTASAGTPATFEGIVSIPAVSETKDLGQVVYTLTYNDKTSTAKSEGKLFAAGKKLVVQVQNNAANIFDSSKHQSYIGVGRLGAVDYVTEIGESDYKLSSGGWIPKDSVTPVAGGVAVKNKVSSSSFKAADKGEALSLTGTSHPMFRATQTDKKLTVKLLNTTGVAKPDISGSKLYSGVKISEENGATTLEFTVSGNKSLWGYDISYKNGVTTIYSQYKPTLDSGNKPLANVTVVLDPGHGGDDPGAIGVPALKGSVESDINYQSALATKKRLETLGAEVIMTRDGDETVSLNERMAIAQQVRADFFLSMHSNSIGFGASSNKAKGVETYYYEDISKKFATAVNNNLTENTGRTNRGTKFANFRVTMNSFCPSALVEMGFITNANEYDQMTTKDAVFQTANAIGDAVVTALS